MKEESSLFFWKDFVEGNKKGKETEEGGLGARRNREEGVSSRESRKEQRGASSRESRKEQRPRKGVRGRPHGAARVAPRGGAEQRWRVYMCVHMQRTPPRRGKIQSTSIHLTMGLGLCSGGGMAREQQWQDLTAADRDVCSS
jgi:hypothetical protein